MFGFGSLKILEMNSSKMDSMSPVNKLIELSIIDNLSVVYLDMIAYQFGLMLAKLSNLSIL